MTQMKTNGFQTVLHQLHRPLTAMWRKCVLAGAREIDELRARPGPLCPQCSGPMIQRRVMFGRDAGREFWDCSNVPRCFVSIAAEEVVWPESVAPASPFAA